MLRRPEGHYLLGGGQLVLHVSPDLVFDRLPFGSCLAQ